MENLSISNFLEPFFPLETEPVRLFGIYPDKTRPQPFKMEVTRARIASDTDLQNLLVYKNKTHGIYFVVNSGGTYVSEINRVNAVFCEMDEGTFSEQHALYDNCGLLPSIRLETNKSVHSYWLLAEEIDVPTWQQIQESLIAKFASDEKIKNPNRLMRLPFFNHVRMGDNGFIYKKVEVKTFEPSQRYVLADFEEVFKPVIKSETRQNYPKFKENDWDKIAQELRYRISLHRTYRLEANRKWGVCQGVCHNGQGNTAISVNWQSGAVSCKNGCSYDCILLAFGLERPEKTKPKFIPRKPQESKTFHWLKGHTEKQKEVQDE